MARSTRIIKSGGIIFLPADTTYPVWKILINGEDVTSYVAFCDANLYATEKLNYVDINLDNYLGRYNGKWDYENESIDIDVYFEYGTASTYKNLDPTNRIFHGKIDKITKGLTNQGWMMNVTGRDRPELVDIRLTLEFDSETIDNAIKAVIAEVNAQAGYDVITEGTIETTATTTSANYREMEGIRILEDLCKRANFDGRINADGSYDVFTRGTKICNDESVASGLNVFSSTGIGVDATDIKNNVRVYGQEVEGCLIMDTKKSTTYQPWRKDLIVNDTAQETINQVKDRASKEYDNQVDGEIKASLVCIGLPNLKVGQSIKTFVAYCDLDDEYVVSHVNHIFSMSGSESRIVLNQLEKDGLKLIKNNDKDIREKSTFNNPNNMEYSYHFTFANDNNVATHSNTETEDGKLKLTTGNDSGTMISNALTLDEDINYAEVRFNGNDDCDLCSFEVSADDGENYDEVTVGTKGDPGTQISISNPGKKLRLKVIMASSTTKTLPEIESCVVLAKQ